MNVWEYLFMEISIQLVADIIDIVYVPMGEDLKLKFAAFYDYKVAFQTNYC